MCQWSVYSVSAVCKETSVVNSFINRKGSRGEVHGREILRGRIYECKDLSWSYLSSSSSSFRDWATACSGFSNHLLRGRPRFRFMITNIWCIYKKKFCCHRFQSKPFKGQWELYVAPALFSITFHFMLICFVSFSPQTAIISLNSVNRLIFVTVKCSVFFAVRTEFLNNISTIFDFEGLNVMFMSTL
jgi:hypothetical protein